MILCCVESSLGFPLWAKFCANFQFLNSFPNVFCGERLRRKGTILKPVSKISTIGTVMLNLRAQHYFSSPKTFSWHSEAGEFAQIEQNFLTPSRPPHSTWGSRRNRPTSQVVSKLYGHAFIRSFYIGTGRKFCIKFVFRNWDMISDSCIPVSRSTLNRVQR